ncbi:Fibronectin type III domain-containing protein [Micromonospora echinofusca]|uniref:Fibronectin type III domain-containing protein n=4 Tax=Actinomycetes TaxID=1760 RepID=A0A1C5G3J7_MICEH|nr:Fibronectin type III domain-containing protein [Micromonospora echinofusca]
MRTSSRPTKSLRRLAGGLPVALAITLALAPTPAAAVPAGGMSATALNTMFQTYGDQGGHWTGGDNTASVALPDGRVAWLFSDTYLGTVNADGTRPAGTPMVNNTLVVQENTSLVSTRHGGSASAPSALVVPTQADQYFWAADGVVEGGALKVLYNRMQRGGSDDNLDFILKGTSLVTFALPGLTVSSVVDLPVGDSVGWGSAILEDGGYTYIYGTSSGDGGMRFGHVARAPAGGFGGAWQYWTGSAWSSTESSAARLLSGVGTTYGVFRSGDKYVLLTQDNNQVFNPQFVTYTADSPTGPFTGPTPLFDAPEAVPGTPKIVYDARVHPELTTSGKLLFSYNVNSLDNADNLSDARLYRPRFIELAWPRPVPDPAALPGVPQAVTATPDDKGDVTLAWQAVAGATGYRLHRRDVTTGQTHFSRESAVATGTSAKIGFLYSGHTYEFRVSAVNTAGEGTPSTTVTAVPRIAPPPAPASVTAVADDAGSITVSWDQVPDAWGYDLLERDLTAGDSEFNLALRPGSTDTQVRRENLEHGHLYEFALVTRNGGGESPRSAIATATAQYALPPAPTGLTATPRSDGSVALAWTAPAPLLWYMVYQRDVTAGEAAFTQLPLPVEGTAITADFLHHGHTYEWKVSATNRGGEGPASGVVQGTSTMAPPAAPTNLRATVGDGKVTLVWDAPSDNVFYHIYQRNVTTGEGEFTELPLPITECCTMTPEFLTNNETYEFKVAASNQGGTGAASTAIQVTPRAPTPAKVTGLTATPQSNGSIRLQWTGPTGNYWYDVYRRDVTAGGSFTKLPLPVTTCCAMTDSLLVHRHVYAYKVVANNGTDGPASDIVQATSNYSPPPAPQNLRARAAGDGSVDLDWDPVGPNIDYWIYQRDVTAGQTSFQKLPLPLTDSAFSAGLLANGHQYEFKVSASNQGGEGATSAAVRVTALGGLPARPANLSADVGNATVRLTWTASATSGVSYDVYQRDVTAGQSWQKLPYPVTTCCAFSGSLLTNGHTYEWRVVATNVHGSSAASNVVSGRPMPPLPGSPSNLVRTVGDGTVRLTWTASPSPNVSYDVYQRDVTAGQSWRKLPYAVGCCSFNGGLLTNGHTYEWKVSATNMTGSSGFSNTVSGRPMPPLPSAPSGLTATPKSNGVTLKWTASTPSNVSYSIYQRDVTTGQSWQKLPLGVSCCTFNGALLINGHTYEWKVLASNITGSSGFSNTVSARPMPPMPKAPGGLLAWGGVNRVTFTWGDGGNSKLDTFYQVYYRNLSDGQTSWSKYRSPIAETKVIIYDFLRELKAYEFKVSAVNISGEVSSSSTVEAIPYRVVPYNSGVRRRGNQDNGSNDWAGIFALAHSTSCQGDWFQTICFGMTPIMYAGQTNPVTVGDFFFYARGGPQRLEEELVCEVRQRLILRRMYGAATANNEGPDLLWHEQIHSVQWSEYSDWGAFLWDYRNDHMRFEKEANLYWGGYKVKYGASRC